MPIFKLLNSGEVLAASRINEARVGASELPKRSAEDMENGLKQIFI